MSRRASFAAASVLRVSHDRRDFPAPSVYPTTATYFSPRR